MNPVVAAKDIDALVFTSEVRQHILESQCSATGHDYGFGVVVDAYIVYEQPSRSGFTGCVEPAIWVGVRGEKDGVYWEGSVV